MRNRIEHFNFWNFNTDNIFNACVYFAVRHCIKTTWINDRDQFLIPKKKWEKDINFQNDSLTFTLFHGQNRISSENTKNHWILFTENEVNSREKFDLILW
ncbi:MAG: hypothetical protein B6I24_01675 [Bacteroidetes bacterium 4572_128]|nr:MAG: hypothetical protein B6I24_01675 [Bacteroidetes bacterium 4572_128]